MTRNNSYYIPRRTLCVEKKRKIEMESERQQEGRQQTGSGAARSVYSAAFQRVRASSEPAFCMSQ